MSSTFSNTNMEGVICMPLAGPRPPFLGTLALSALLWTALNHSGHTFCRDVVKRQWFLVMTSKCFTLTPFTRTVRDVDIITDGPCWRFPLTGSGRLLLSRLCLFNVAKNLQKQSKFNSKFFHTRQSDVGGTWKGADLIIQRLHFCHSGADVLLRISDLKSISHGTGIHNHG